MIRLLLLVIAVISGAASIWMFVNRPEQPTPVVEEAVDGVPFVEGPESENDDEVRLDDETSELPVVQYEVLVAANDIIEGSRLSSLDTEWLLVDEKDIPAGAFNREDYPNANSLILGRVLSERVNKGDFILAAHIVEAEQKSLSMILEPGERAISISVTEDIMAGGFILPGDRVDIIHVGPIDGGSVESRVLARNVEVIALDQNMSDAINGTNYVSRTATLVVGVKEVPTISAAIEAPGRLSLALRSLSEVEELERGIGDTSPDNEQRTIRVIRNGVSETVRVRP